MSTSTVTTTQSVASAQTEDNDATNFILECIEYSDRLYHRIQVLIHRNVTRRETAITRVAHYFRQLEYDDPTIPPLLTQVDWGAVVDEYRTGAWRDEDRREDLPYGARYEAYHRRYAS